MSRIRTTVTTLVFAFVLIASASLSGCTGQVTLPEQLDKVQGETAANVNDHVGAMKPSSTGGEWALIGLIKSGRPEAKARSEEYLKNLATKLQKNHGKLTDTKYGDYARATIVLSLLGKDPRNFEGVDLVSPLDDYNIVSEQGVTVEAFALIASKMAGVTLKNQQLYMDDIYEDVSNSAHFDDPVASDYLAMELQAVVVCGEAAPKDLKEMILAKLRDLAKSNKAYDTSESVSQVIIALTEAGINPYKDELYFQDGRSPAQWLMSYYVGDGGFVHVKEEKEENQFATESALLALDSLKLMEKGGRLYEK